MWLTSRTLPYGAVAFFTTPLSSTVALPCLLVAGLPQVMLLGFDACTRANTLSVGSVFCGLPLNSSTQPLIWNRPLAVAVAVPLPTSAFLQAAIAAFIVLFWSWPDEHLAAAFGLSLQFLSR